MFVNAPPAYYRIQLDPQPVLIRIRSTHTAQFSYFYPGNRPCLFEINYLQKGDLCEMREEGEFRYRENTVHTLVANRTFTQYSDAPLLQEFFMMVDLARPAEPMTEEQVSLWVPNDTEAIIPEYITDPVLCRQIGNRLKALYEAAPRDPCLQLSLRSELYGLLAILTRYSLTQACNLSATTLTETNPHVRRATAYIEDHLSEHFTVTEVAQAVGISYNHLKNLFQQHIGMSLVEYANHTRIRLVQQLLASSDTTLEEAGNRVGIQDPAYLSRIFRKYTGVSVRQYRRLQKEKIAAI